MKRFLVSLSAAAVVFSAATPAFARIMPTAPMRGDRSNNVSSEKTVRKGRERITVKRATRRGLIMRTRARWPSQSERPWSSSSSSSSSSASSN